MSVDYIIVSKPNCINFKCPHCHEDIELPFEEDYWKGWVWVDCTECGKKVELGDYIYD